MWLPACPTSFLSPNRNSQPYLWFGEAISNLAEWHTAALQNWAELGLKVVQINECPPSASDWDIHMWHFGLSASTCWRVREAKTFAWCCHLAEILGTVVYSCLGGWRVFRTGRRREWKLLLEDDDSASRNLSDNMKSLSLCVVSAKKGANRSSAVWSTTMRSVAHAHPPQTDVREAASPQLKGISLCILLRCSLHGV